MGNVLAATAVSDAARNVCSSNDSVATNLGNLPELLTSRDAETVVSETLEKLPHAKLYQNPGTVEDLHKKCKDVQAIPFEGAKVMLNKGLSNHFQISHTLNMSSPQQSGYRFGATYVGTKHYSPSEAFPVLLADIDPAGNLNANIIHQISPYLRFKFASQIQDSQMVGSQLATEFRSSSYTASVTIGNPSIVNNSCVIVGQYLQSVNACLALGAELVYQYNANMPGQQIAIVSVVGRYARGDAIWSGRLSPGGVDVCYYQRASDQLQIGVEVETSLRLQESIATIAYQIDLPKADLVFRGSIDSNWQLTGVLEKRLVPLPFSFALSGRMNTIKSSFKLGCGLMIG